MAYRRAVRKAATELGYTLPVPAANMSRRLHQPARRAARAVHLLRLLRGFGCGNYSKASPQTTILPVLLATAELRAAHRLRGDPRSNSTPDKKRATGVTYVDSPPAGEFEQPAEIVILSRLRAAQRAPAAAVGHRQALRPGTGQGVVGKQLRLPDRSSRHRVLRRQDTSTRSSAPARSARRSTTSTATISTTPGSASSAAATSPAIRPGPADREPSGAAGHAALGRANGRRRSPATTTTTCALQRTAR